MKKLSVKLIILLSYLPILLSVQQHLPNGSFYKLALNGFLGYCGIVICVHLVVELKKLIDWLYQTANAEEPEAEATYELDVEAKAT